MRKFPIFSILTLFAFGLTLAAQNPSIVDVDDPNIVWAKETISYHRLCNETEDENACKFPCHLLEEVQERKLRAYDIRTNEVLDMNGVKDIMDRLNSVDTIEVLSPGSYEYEMKVVHNIFQCEDMDVLRTMQEWTFNRETLMLGSNTLSAGLARSVIDDNGKYRGIEYILGTQTLGVNADLKSIEEQKGLGKNLIRTKKLIEFENSDRRSKNLKILDKSLGELLLEGVKQNDLKALDAKSKKPLTKIDVENHFANKDTIEVLNPNTYEYETQVIEYETKYTDLNDIIVEELWYYDEKEGMLYNDLVSVTIIGRKNKKAEVAPIFTIMYD